jgi:hypothetical protein
MRGLVALGRRVRALRSSHAAARVAARGAPPGVTQRDDQALAADHGRGSAVKQSPRQVRFVVMAAQRRTRNRSTVPTEVSCESLKQDSRYGCGSVRAPVTGKRVDPPAHPCECDRGSGQPLEHFPERGSHVHGGECGDFSPQPVAGLLRCAVAGGPPRVSANWSRAAPD